MLLIEAFTKVNKVAITIELIFLYQKRDIDVYKQYKQKSMERNYIKIKRTCIFNLFVNTNFSKWTFI